MENDTEARNQAIEFAMKATDDEVVVARIADAAPGTDDAYKALARLTLAVDGDLRHDDPPIAWIRQVDAAPGWRTRRPDAEGSLWGELQTLRVVTPDPGSDHLLDELFLRREMLEAA
ncbi:MAG: hypothetical protein GY882_01760 [Actinomycetia bacterium]|nr:hypothetical protein [Actinomycetes bacterium]MCP4844897.1 hypothetical protein [Actinomycetes bacterium]